MPRLSMRTEIGIDITGGRQHVFDVWIDYDFSPAVPAYTPPGEYGPIDPPESASVEIVAARWRPWSDAPTSDRETFQDCPGWLIALMDSDDDLHNELIYDAEESARDALAECYADDVDEQQEWRDFDADC